MKLTRRGMLALAGASAALAQLPAPPPAAANPDLLEKAREDNRRAAGVLAKFDLPMATEPAFTFRP